MSIEISIKMDFRMSIEISIKNEFPKIIVEMTL